MVNDFTRQTGIKPRYVEAGSGLGANRVLAQRADVVATLPPFLQVAASKAVPAPLKPAAIDKIRVAERRADRTRRSRPGLRRRDARDSPCLAEPFASSSFSTSGGVQTMTVRPSDQSRCRAGGGGTQMV